VDAGATLDLNGFSNTIGSLAGNGSVINSATTAPVTLTVGIDNTSTTFSGVIGPIGAGDISITKIGSGTLVLTGNNLYSGSTTISGGTLELGNGGVTGAIAGNVIDNATLAFNRSNQYTFAGTINGTGRVLQAGTGTLTLSGSNSYSGGTEVDSGTLAVDNSSALGVGNVTVNAGILTADPQPINVQGNYFQSANGTLQLTVAAARPGRYDYLNVTGNAILGGTLQLINQGFPQSRRKLDPG
jgi:fibronectin-binding autotransporter adhesin